MPCEALAKQGFVRLYPAKKNRNHMKYVYLLESISSPGKHYIGITSNLDARLKDHNAGQSPHTARFKPWKMSVAVRFDNDHRAEAIERYLKSGSGHAFAKRHLW
jgi:predicted GIY-YIG superfamily endonuclease